MLQTMKEVEAKSELAVRGSRYPIESTTSTVATVSRRCVLQRPFIFVSPSRQPTRNLIQTVEAQIQGERKDNAIPSTTNVTNSGRSEEEEDWHWDYTPSGKVEVWAGYAKRKLG
jgi:hypothetical protein